MELQTPLETQRLPDFLPKSPQHMNPDLLQLQSFRKAQEDVQGNCKERQPTFRRSNTLPILTKSDPEFKSSFTMRSGTGRRSSLLHRRSNSPPEIKPYQAKNTDRLKTPDFNALVRKSNPIPQFLDPVDDKQEFKIRSIQEWKDQVVKIVPQRPSFAIAMDWKAPPAEWDDRDYYLYSPKPMFYKNKKYVSERDFIVNPEWVSEKKKVSVYSPAYRTCALRYGWNC